MKHPKTKRTATFLSLLLSLCLLCTSCYPAADPEGKFDPPQSDGVLREGNWDYDLSEVPYHYGNVMTGYMRSEFCDYGSKVLFTAGLNPAMLFEYDKRTGRVDTFCKNAACRHNSPSCPAYNIQRLELYNGTVYGLQWIVPQNETDPAFAYNLTELKNGRFQTLMTPVFRFQHNDNKRYIVTLDGVLKYCPMGSDNWETIMEENVPVFGIFSNEHYYYGGNKDGKIYRMELNSLKEEEIIPYLTHIFITDGEYIFYEDGDRRIFRCDLDGKNVKQIFESGLLRNYDEKYFYFNGYDPTDETNEVNNQLFRVPKDLSAEPELLADIGFSTAVFIAHEFDALFLVSDDRYYTINKDGTDLRELELPIEVR